MNNTRDGFLLDIEKRKVTLEKTDYPSNSNDKFVKKYLSKKIMNTTCETEKKKNKENI